jgi:hypothetical protein
MADVVLCEYQKKNFFYQDVTVREDLLCGRSTMHACPKSRSKDITTVVLLATVTIVLSRTRERGARNKTFGISSGTKIHSRPIPV